MTYVLAVYLLVGLAVGVYGIHLAASFRQARKALQRQGEHNE